MPHLRSTLLALVTVLLSACGPEPPPGTPVSTVRSGTAMPVASAPTASASAPDGAPDEPARVFLGDGRMRHGGYISAIAVDSTGARVATGGWDQMVRVWDAADGKRISTCPAGGDPRAIALSRGGALVAVSRFGRSADALWGMTNLVVVCDTHDGSVVRELQIDDLGCCNDALAFDAAGDRLWASGPKKLVSWDARTWTRTETPIPSGRTVRSFWFAPNGHVWMLGWDAKDDATLIVHDATAGTDLERHRPRVRAAHARPAAFAPSGAEVAMGDGDGSVWLYGHGGVVRHLTTALPPAPVVGPRTPPPPDVQAIAYSPDGTLLATADEVRGVVLWDAASLALVRRVMPERRLVHDVQFTPDGRTLLVEAFQPSLLAFDVQTGEPRYVFEAHGGPVVAVAVSPDGSRIATGSDDETVRIWDARSARTLHAVAIPANGYWAESQKVTALAWSRDGRNVFVGATQERVLVVDAETGAITATVEADDHKFRKRVRLSVARDGSALFTLTDLRLRRFDLPSLAQRSEHLGMDLSAMAALRDAPEIVVAERPYVTIVTADGLREHHTIELLGGTVALLAAGPAGQLAMDGPAGHVSIWSLDALDTTREPARPSPLAAIAADAEQVLALAYSEDGKLLATAGRERVVRVWDTRTFELVRELRGHEDRIVALAWAPDGRHLVSGSHDTTAIVWSLAPPSATTR
ncbi:MAG: hypothetical protein IT374_05690 [Polyangiaceae bacterium]|nr:hypothetical protein [Polyangiaceae bacterium]